MSFYHFAEGSRDFDFHLDVSASLVLWLGKVFVVRIFPCSWQIFFYSDKSKLLQNRQPVVKIEVGNLLFPEQAEYIYIVVCQRGRPFNLIYWLGITQCNSPNFWEIKKLIVRFQHACDEYSCSTKWVGNFKETMEFEQFILWQLIKEILYYILKLKKLSRNLAYERHISQSLRLHLIGWYDAPPAAVQSNGPNLKVCMRIFDSWIGETPQVFIARIFGIK